MDLLCIMVRFLAVERDFSFLQSVLTDSRIHSGFCSLVLGALVPDKKQPDCEADHSPV